MSEVEPVVERVEASFGPLQLVESLLFVAAEPVPVRDLARVLALPLDTIEAALERLAHEYRDRGMRVMRHHDQVQLVTAPEAAAAVERFLGIQTSAPRLSNAALETLAIIAYKQPILRADIEAIRGVACGETIRSLMEKHLVKIAGRAEEPGRPILYGTTKRFLELFGLNSLKDLPQPDANKPQG